MPLYVLAARGEIWAHCFPALPIFFAEILLKHFSGTGFGQAIDEFDGAWTFVMRQSRTAELNEFGFRHGMRSASKPPAP